MFVVAEYFMPKWEYLISTSLYSIASADLCLCVVCRIWGHPARRSGLATMSYPL